MSWVIRSMLAIHDSLVIPSVLSLVAALVYALTGVAAFGFLGVASLIVYNISNIIIFFKFSVSHSTSNLVVAQEIVGEKLLISIANLVGVILLITLEF